jgi:hypothetical protein
METETKPLSVVDGPCASCGKPVTEESFFVFVGKNKRLIWHVDCSTPKAKIANQRS